jgi:hypothetical protein
MIVRLSPASRRASGDGGRPAVVPFGLAAASAGAVTAHASERSSQACPHMRVSPDCRVGQGLLAPECGLLRQRTPGGPAELSILTGPPPCHEPFDGSASHGYPRLDSENSSCRGDHLSRSRPSFDSQPYGGCDPIDWASQTMATSAGVTQEVGVSEV